MEWENCIESLVATTACVFRCACEMCDSETWEMRRLLEDLGIVRLRQQVSLYKVIHTTPVKICDQGWISRSSVNNRILTYDG